MKYYIGIDVGGMSLKGMRTDAEGNVLAEGGAPTDCGNGGKNLTEGIARLCLSLMDGAEGELGGVGIGCPGVIESATGTIIFAGNLGLKNYPLGEELEKLLKTTVKVTNDANAAALGEARFGAGKEYKNSILVTLGTGVGGGIIIDGKLFEGNKSAGAEIGHMVIERYGERCTCGRRGCFEAYSSATALMRRTKWAMEENPVSDMWKTYTSDTCTGKTAFEYAETDRTAREVVDWYVNYLACGLINLANIFRPEVIMLGGGVSAQGENLTAPLQAIVDKEVFGGGSHAPVKILTASLGNKAGALGAAALNM
ncbi:MAG: ROK family protein [Candidatus Coproplasma sp.]